SGRWRSAQGRSCTSETCLRICSIPRANGRRRKTSSCRSRSWSGAPFCGRCGKPGGTSWRPPACWASEKRRCTGSGSSITPNTSKPETKLAIEIIADGNDFPFDSSLVLRCGRTGGERRCAAGGRSRPKTREGEFTLGKYTSTKPELGYIGQRLAPPQLLKSLILLRLL